MRNPWKGLVIGGLTGVFAGVILDVLSGAREKVVTATENAREKAPMWGDKAKHAAERAVERLRESELPDRARQTAERIRDSDIADGARAAADRVREAPGN